MKLRRIFALVPDCHARNSRYGVVWQRHFYDGLRESGLEVSIPKSVSFDWARPASSIEDLNTTRMTETSRALSVQINQALRSGIDAVISYCFSHDIDLDLVDRVREAGVPWINFFCDSVYAFHTVAALARRTSLNWFVESASENLYQELGVPYLCVPYALNASALTDATCRSTKRTLSFVGSANKPRIKALAQLRLAGVDVHASGWGWPEALVKRTPVRWSAGSVLNHTYRRAARAILKGRVSGFLEFDEYLECLRESQILLGLNEGGLGKKPYVSYLKLRDVEYPGHGCCYLVQHNEDIARIFEPGKEILTFRTIREARDNVRRMAQYPDECRRMGQRARQRVLAEHTWRARLPQLAKALV